MWRRTFRDTDCLTRALITCNISLVPIPARSVDVRPPLLRQGVHAQLQTAIVDGTLAPGEVVRDQELASWLGVSRTPVREALLKLADAGLVEATPGRSTRIAAINPAAIRDAQAVVAAMHRLAVTTAISRVTPAHLSVMREANQRFRAAIELGDVEAALGADDAFHGVLVELAGNTALAAVLDQFTPAIRRLERLRFASHAGRGSVDLHDRLVDLCERGDVTAAAQVSDQTWDGLQALLDFPLTRHEDHAQPKPTNPRESL